MYLQDAAQELAESANTGIRQQANELLGWLGQLDENAPLPQGMQDAIDSLQESLQDMIDQLQEAIDEGQDHLPDLFKEKLEEALNARLGEVEQGTSAAAGQHHCKLAAPEAITGNPDQFVQIDFGIKYSGFGISGSGRCELYVDCKERQSAKPSFDAVGGAEEKEIECDDPGPHDVCERCILKVTLTMKFTLLTLNFEAGSTGQDFGPDTCTPVYPKGSYRRRLGGPSSWLP